jgi:hypothetical protein
MSVRPCLLWAAAILAALWVSSCCPKTARIEPRHRQFTASFGLESHRDAPIFEVRPGALIRAVEIRSSSATIPAACNVMFQCPGCGTFPLRKDEQVVAVQMANVMLSAAGEAPVTCRVTVVD